MAIRQDFRMACIYVVTSTETILRHVLLTTSLLHLHYMQSIYVIKIGGSVATHKSSATPRIRTALLTRIFTILRHTRKHDPSLRIILVHGAGSFGHTLAKKYELIKGSHAHKEGVRGALQTHIQVSLLHTKIMELLKKADLPAFSFPTSSHVTQTKGRIIKSTFNPLHDALKEGYIPVCSGDMVFDTAWGMSVCSGDAVIAELMRHFPVTTALFATDVAGVHTDDPYTKKDTLLIPHISQKSYGTHGITLTDSHHTDVTGGLKTKIEACMDMFEKSTLTKIHVFNGLHPENFIKIFAKKDFPHTVITKT